MGTRIGRKDERERKIKKKKDGEREENVTRHVDTPGRGKSSNRQNPWDRHTQKSTGSGRRSNSKINSSRAHPLV